MMALFRRGPSLASQNAQITHAEAKVLERRRKIKRSAAVLKRTIRTQLASPVMLLGAVELGFAVDQISTRRPGLPPGNAQQSNDEPFGRVLKLVALARKVSSLLTATPHPNTEAELSHGVVKLSD